MKRCFKCKIIIRLVQNIGITMAFMTTTAGLHNGGQKLSFGPKIIENIRCRHVVTHANNGGVPRLSMVGQIIDNSCFSLLSSVYGSLRSNNIYNTELHIDQMPPDDRYSSLSDARKEEIVEFTIDLQEGKAEEPHWEFRVTPLAETPDIGNIIRGPEPDPPPEYGIREKVAKYSYEFNTNGMLRSMASGMNVSQALRLNYVMKQGTGVINNSNNLNSRIIDEQLGDVSIIRGYDISRLGDDDEISWYELTLQDRPRFSVIGEWRYIQDARYPKTKRQIGMMIEAYKVCAYQKYNVMLLNNSIIQDINKKSANWGITMPTLEISSITTKDDVRVAFSQVTEKIKTIQDDADKISAENAGKITLAFSYILSYSRTRIGYNSNLINTLSSNRIKEIVLQMESIKNMHMQTLRDAQSKYEEEVVGSTAEALTASKNEADTSVSGVCKVMLRKTWFVVLTVVAPPLALAVAAETSWVSAPHCDGTPQDCGDQGGGTNTWGAE